MSTLTIFTFTLFAFMTLAVGCPKNDRETEIKRCHTFMQTFCADDDNKPYASDCAIEVILKTRLHHVPFTQTPKYIQEYFTDHLLNSFTISGMKTVDTFCEDEAYLGLHSEVGVIIHASFEDIMESRANICKNQLEDYKDGSSNNITGLPNIIHTIVNNNNLYFDDYDRYNRDEPQHYVKRFLLHVADSVNVSNDDPQINPENYCNTYDYEK